MPNQDLLGMDVACSTRSNRSLRFKMMCIVLVLSALARIEECEASSKHPDWSLEAENSFCQFDVHSLNVSGASQGAEFLALDMYKLGTSEALFSEHVLSRSEATTQLKDQLNLPVLRCGTDGTDQTCVTQARDASVKQKAPLIIEIELSSPTTM